MKYNLTYLISLMDIFVIVHQSVVFFRMPQFFSDNHINKQVFAKITKINKVANGKGSQFCVQIWYVYVRVFL